MTSDPSAGAPFFLRLVAPRPTFALDMTAEEAAIMKEHADWWRGQLQAGVAIAFGPVMDPAGPWGLCLVRVADEAAARALVAGDPIIRAGRGFRYDVFPMLALVSR